MSDAQTLDAQPDFGADLFHVELATPSKLFYAFSHNRIPLVRNLSITNVGAQISGALTVELSLNWTREQRPPAKPFSFMIEAPTEIGRTVSIADIPLRLEDTVMSDLEEAVPAVLTLQITTEEGRSQRAEAELQILARNQWALVGGYEELIASYVQPNHPETKEILRAASKILEQRTGSSSIEGYQSGPERAKQIAQAMFEALQAKSLVYINPPASFEVNQKIRPLDEVLDSGTGTCIDLACAYASCLEQAGLRPLIWLVPGHALTGFLTEEGELDSSVESDTNTVINLTDSGLAQAVEAVCLTDGTSYDNAVSATRIRLTPDAKPVVIDVHRAHRSGSLPLPARVVRDGVVTIVVDPGPGAAPAVEKRAAATGERLTGSVPLRITRWKSSLLDLTYRNPLLNFSTSRRGLDLLVPPAGLSTIEDDLLLGKQLKVVPGDKLEGAQTAAGLRHATEVNAETLAELYNNLGLLYSPSGETEGKKRARALGNRARLIESETGANSLYLVLGKLIWDRKGKAGERTEIQSPLFLVPVKLVRARGSTLFHVVADDEAQTTPNYCLIEKMKAEYGLQVPEFERPRSDGAGIDLEASMQAFRRGLHARGLRFRVDETAHLAILEFAKFRLWKDMEDHWQTFLENKVVRHMVESPGVPFNATAGSTVESLTEEDELDVLCPVPADGAQLKAIARALRGDSFVLQGPPGTGKSQTITNLLASALARGKRVLFVAEKQAALSVVRDRLQSVSLDPYFLDLHDKGSKPQQIRDQLKSALEATHFGDDRQFKEVQSTLGALQKRLAHYRDTVYEENPQGLSFAKAFEETLRLGDGVTAEVPAATLSVDTAEVDRLLQALRDAEAAIDIARPSKNHPWSFVAGIEFQAVDRPALAQAIQALAEALEGMQGVPNVYETLSEMAQSAGDLREVALVAQGLERGTVPSAGIREKAASGSWSTAVEGELKELKKSATAVESLRSRAGRTVFTYSVSKVEEAQRKVAEAASSFFLLRRGKTRKALQEMLVTDTLPKLSWQECLALSSEVAKARSGLESAHARLIESAVDPLPADFDPNDLSTFEPLEKWVADVTRVATVCSRTDALGEKIREAAYVSPSVPSGLVHKLAKLAKAVEAILEHLPAPEDKVREWVGQQGLVPRFAEQLPAWQADATEQRFLRLQRWLDLSSMLEPARRIGLNAYADAILAGEVPAEEAGTAFARGLALASLRERSLTHGLDTFDRVSHENVIRRYTDALNKRQEILKETIPQMLLASRTFNANASMGEIGELRIELNKKRNVKSVRRLLTDYPSLIQQLTPCFLMSPTSVAQFISPGSMTFDLVVFDEASQIDVAEAIGAMGRAEAVVIVGDSKQMPPTRMFDSGSGEDDVFAPQATDEEEVPEDGESLLIEAVDSIQMDQEWLSWHYRSQDETLIAFSNSKYYDSALSSFPSPYTGHRAALTWNHVPNGQFSHGGKRTNPFEARAVVAEVVRRLNHPEESKHSIGVVTLNRQQQDEIVTQLEETGNERVLELLASDADDSLLVRNLENIQGQERDVIILSTGFSRPERGGKMPLNFGPLNRQGGERRLNVAITRARRELLVFSSFQPEDIEESRTGAMGLLDLKAFLEMAKFGSERSRVATAEEETLKLYRDDIKAALEARGIEVRVDMGLSPFKVDLAARPAGAREWRAAILLDGGRWSRRRTTVDRDALPVTVLRKLMGWPTVLRVWLPSWQAEKDALTDELAKAIYDAPAPGLAAPVDDETTTDDWDAEERQHEVVVADTVAECSQEPQPFMGRAPVAPVAPSIAEFEPYPDFPRFGISTGWTAGHLPYQTANRVRTAIEDATEFEGPIEIERLAKHVVLRFGISRLHSSRFAQIARLVPAQQTHKSELGTFVWPQDVSPNEYVGFRQSADASRKIEEIAPEEIGNAMAYLVGQANSMQQEEMFRTTAELFGIRRLTAGISLRLELAAEAAVVSGRLEHRNGRFTVGPRMSSEGLSDLHAPGAGGMEPPTVAAAADSVAPTPERSAEQTPAPTTSPTPAPAPVQTSNSASLAEATFRLLRSRLAELGVDESAMAVTDNELTWWGHDLPQTFTVSELNSDQIVWLSHSMPVLFKVPADRMDIWPRFLNSMAVLGEFSLDFGMANNLVTIGFSGRLPVVQGHVTGNVETLLRSALTISRFAWFVRSSELEAAGPNDLPLWNPPPPPAGMSVPDLHDAVMTPLAGLARKDGDSDNHIRRFEQMAVRLKPANISRADAQHVYLERIQVPQVGITATVRSQILPLVDTEGVRIEYTFHTKLTSPNVLMMLNGLISRPSSPPAGNGAFSSNGNHLVYAETWPVELMNIRGMQQVVSDTYEATTKALAQLKYFAESGGKADLWVGPG